MIFETVSYYDYREGAKVATNVGQVVYLADDWELLIVICQLPA
jgi:hypothetical protein